MQKTICIKQLPVTNAVYLPVLRLLSFYTGFAAFIPLLCKQELFYVFFTWAKFGEKCSQLYLYVAAFVTIQIYLEDNYFEWLIEKDHAGNRALI